MRGDRRSHGLWEASAIPAPKTEALTENITADVIVVGGGFTCTSTARNLAKAGHSVVLLEAYEIGYGASGRNAGLVNGGMWIMPEDVGRAVGARHADRIYSLLASGPGLVKSVIKDEGIDCQLVENGTLYLAYRNKGLVEMRERVRQRRARGANVELLSASETHARLGGGTYTGALFDPEAATVQPLSDARGVASAAIRHGARIYTDSPVVGFERVGTSWRVKTPTGSVTAGRIVVSTDAYSIGPWKKVAEEEVNIPFFNVSTPPLPDDIRRTILPNREGCWDTRPLILTIRLDAAGRLILSGAGAVRHGGMATHGNWSRRAIEKVFPQLRGKLTWEHAWFGQIGTTTDHAPRFHRLDDRIVGFSGYNGRGIATGTVFGKALADLVTGVTTEKDLPLPLTDLERRPFRALRHVYYEAGAQIGHSVMDRI